jgi:hypothetical protein
MLWLADGLEKVSSLRWLPASPDLSPLESANLLLLLRENTKMKVLA